MRSRCLLTVSLVLAIYSPALAQQPLPPPGLEPLPKIIKPLPLPPISKPADKPDKPDPAPKKAGAPAVPFRTTTAAIEVVGNANLPEPLAEFRPVRLATGPIEVVGVYDPSVFRPVRLTTPPIEVVGAEE